MRDGWHAAARGESNRRGADPDWQRGWYTWHRQHRTPGAVLRRRGASLMGGWPGADRWHTPFARRLARPDGQAAPVT